MAETSQQVDIPNRALFKAAEVCDLAKVQPYVLRSWEAEFKDLGVAKTGSNARVYRREDVERVLRIKHLLLIEGLTLAGVRRKLEEEAEPPLDQQQDVAGPIPTALPEAARARIGSVKQGLRSLLDLLDGPVAASAERASAVTADGTEFALAPPTGEEPGAGKGARGTSVGDDGTKTASPRRKRSA